MAKQARGKDGTRTKRTPVTYFFLNDQLHKKLTINRGKDTITAWNYPEGSRKVYTYSTWLRRHGKAFTTAQVAEMVNRSKSSLEDALRDGMIERPQFTYGLNERRKMYKYMWSEKDIMRVHAYYSTVHRGRPRKDGLITPAHLPTPAELRAMINDENVLYIKHGDQYIPSWKAKELG